MGRTHAVAPWQIIDKKRNRIAVADSNPKENGGGKGIRTLVGLLPNGFQDRLVMTASISLHGHAPRQLAYSSIFEWKSQVHPQPLSKQGG